MAEDTTIELYIENNDKNYRGLAGLPPMFHGWGIITERKDGYTVHYPREFASHEDLTNFIENLKPKRIKKHFVDMYYKLTTYSDVNNHERDYVVLTYLEDLGKKSNKYRSSIKMNQIRIPKMDSGINYEDYFGRILRFSKGIHAATPLGALHERKLIPPVLKRALDFVKEKQVVRRLIVYAAALTTVFGVGKGIFTLVTNGINSGNGGDFMLLDEPVNNTDRMLYSNRSNYAPKIETLAGYDNKTLSTKDKENTLKYVDSLVGSNHDGNASLNRINLSELLPRGNYSVETSQSQYKQSLILEDIESKYENCFCRPYAKNDNIAIDERHVSKFLNKAIPYIIFNSGYFEERGIANVPSNFESSNYEHPSGDDIRAFKGIPDIDKYIIACQAIEMYKRCPEYTFIHQAFPLNSNPLEALFKAKEEFRNRILNSNDVSQEAKIDLLLDASDELMEKQAKSGK